MATKTSRKKQNKWQSSADDAIKLAAIRWFAATIEAQCIQIYATKQANYPEIEVVLRGAVARLEGIKKDIGLAEEDCPPGYVLCGSECAPMCYSEN